jgi:hypothetical protein
MSLKAPFVDRPGRKKNVHADDNIGTLAPSETTTANNFVSPLDINAPFDLPPSNVDAVPSLSTGTPDDAHSAPSSKHGHPSAAADRIESISVRASC